MDTKEIQREMVGFKLNGKPRKGYVEPRLILSDFLRHELGTLSVHVGCEHGVCGACTILVDGKSVRSCLMLAVQAQGSHVETAESLASVDEMSDLQQAFRRHHALQCGFCTAGILMSCVDFLVCEPDPTEEQVRDMLSGHLCRCTGYTGIVRAVLDVANERKIKLENKNCV
jgi:2-furoyl-CoA dehydrogenase 2Fe-2S iron sulfur subunit